MANKKLRVGNLGFAIDADKLKEIFQVCGSVRSAKVVESPYSGVSRGFGFIEMSNETEAASCIERLHGHEHEGRVLAVTEAPIERTASGRVRRSVK